MSEFEGMKLKDASPEILNKLFAEFTATHSEEEEAVNELIRNVANGRCAIRDVIGLDDSQMEALYSIGFNYYRGGRYDDALKVFRGLCLFDQMELKYWLGLGGSFQMLKNYEDAIQAYSMGMYLNSKDLRSPFHAAECYIALGDREKAESALEAVLAFGDKNSQKDKPFLDKAEAILKLLRK